MEKPEKISDTITISIPKGNPWTIVSAVLAVVLIISWAQILTLKGTAEGPVPATTSPTGAAATAATSTQAQPSQTDTTEAQSGQSSGVGEKYQQMVDQLSGLEEKTEGCDPSIINAVQGLSREVHDLRVLNPYYRFQEIKNSALPSGIPEYGAELGVSYDNAADGVNVLAKLERDIGFDNLNEEEKARYIKIGTTQGTACEFCCGLKTSFAKEDGQRACGCAHNIAFSGLTMWMIQNGYTDEQILEEIQNWKALFFPKQTISKVVQEKIEAGEEGIEELLEEFPDFLPQMVGGC